MRRASAVILAALLAAASAQGPKPSKMKMAPPVKLAFAGAKIALPADFKLLPSENISMLLRAVKMRGDQWLLLITLSGFPEHPKTTLRDFTHNRGPKKDRNTRGFRMLKSTDVKAGGVAGEVQVQSYRLGRIERTALALYLLRPVFEGKGQIGYLLTVEAEKKNGKLMLPVLMAVMKTIELSDPISPLAEKMEALGDPIVSKRWGYSVRPPMWWKVSAARGLEKVTISQADYTFSGRIHPELHFEAGDAQGQSAEQVAEVTIRKIAADITTAGFKYELLSRQAAKLAGIDGQEFVIRSVATPPVGKEELSPRTLILAQRVICHAGNTYTLACQAETEDVKVVSRILEAAAAGVELTAATTRPAPTTGPAVRAVPTTVPAAVTPSTAPAIRLVPTTAPATVTPATITPAAAPTTRPAPAVKSVSPATQKELEELEKLIPG